MRQRKMQGRKTHRSVIHILWIVPWSAWRHFSKRIKSSTPSSKTELKEILLRDFPIVPRTDNPRETWREKFLLLKVKLFIPMSSKCHSSLRLKLNSSLNPTRWLPYSTDSFFHDFSFVFVSHDKYQSYKYEEEEKHSREICLHLTQPNQILQLNFNLKTTKHNTQTFQTWDIWGKFWKSSENEGSGVASPPPFPYPRI